MTRVNVEGIAFTDGRFRLLAKLLGYADGDHARSKMEYLWLACTTRGELELPKWLIEEFLGPTGPDALIEAELGRWTTGRGDSNTRRMYICGARGRTEWYAHNQRQSPKGGKARASTASRVGGRFVQEAAGEFTSALPPALPLPHAHPPERESDPQIANAQPVELDPDALSPESDSKPPPPEPPEVAASRARPLAIAPDPRIRINHDAWSYGAREHARLRAAGIEPHAPAWPAIPVGQAALDLVAITRELTNGDPPDFAHAAVVHKRRIDVAVAEVMREEVKHLRWFTPSRIFKPSSFWIAAEMSPQQAAARKGPSRNEPTVIRAPAFGDHLADEESA